MSAAQEGYYQDRMYGVTVSVQMLPQTPCAGQINAQWIRDARGIAVKLETNGTAGNDTRKKVMERALGQINVGVLDTNSGTYIFGKSKAVVNFLMPRTDALLDTSFKADLESIYKAQPRTKLRG